MTYQVIPQNLQGSEPAPNVATLEEIQLAEELRRRLDLRFLRGNDAHDQKYGAVR